MNQTIRKPSITRRERRVSARKNQILDAAITLFAEKGYHRTTTKDIAEAADISEGTIYNYFDRKEDLLIGIMDRLANPGDFENISPMVSLDSREFLQAIVERRLEIIRGNYPTFRAVLSEILVNPEIAERYYHQIVQPVQFQIEVYLQRRLDQGEVRTIDPALTARFLVAAIFGLFFLESMGDSIVSGSESFGSILIHILFDGIQPVEGLP